MEAVHGPFTSLLVLTFCDFVGGIEKSEESQHIFCDLYRPCQEQPVRGTVGLWHRLVVAGAISVLCDTGTQLMLGAGPFLLCD